MTEPPLLLRDRAGDINGDARLGIGTSILYLMTNGRRWLQRNPRRAMFNRWRVPGEVRREVRRLQASPGRILARAFVLTNLPGHLRGREVAVLDIGCGSGGASRWFEAAGLHGSYLGIDSETRFSNTPGAALVRDFQCTDAHDFEPECLFDVVFSNSALEHIPDDVDLWRRLRGHLSDGGVQLHIVPSRGALLAYLWHGFRQYGPRDIVARVDPDNARVFRLGGIGSLGLHFLFITVPEAVFRFSLRRRLPRVYGRLLSVAFAIDRLVPFGSLMYAVIETRPATPVAAEPAST